MGHRRERYNAKARTFPRSSKKRKGTHKECTSGDPTEEFDTNVAIITRESQNVREAVSENEMKRVRLSVGC